VAEHLPDLRERRAGPQQLGGRGVSEPVGSHGWEAGLASSTDHDGKHSARRQRPVWSSHAEEEAPRFGNGPGTPQIGRDGPPDVDR
jgi:hypothetical protein